MYIARLRRWSTSAAVLVASLVTAGAARADLPAPPGFPDFPQSGICALSRSPAVVGAWFQLGYYAPETSCSVDRDGNGLDDTVENDLAACFMPHLLFDKKENALLPGEPHALYQVHRTGRVDEHPQYESYALNVNLLWAADGGFAADDSFITIACSDTHAGDSQGLPITVYVYFAPGPTGPQYFAIPHDLPFELSTEDILDGTELRSPVGIGAPTFDLFGTHPVIYPSAGKHHYYATADVREFHVDAGTLGDYECGDSALGDGTLVDPIFTPAVAHVPALNTSFSGPGGITPYTAGNWLDQLDVCGRKRA